MVDLVLLGAVSSGATGESCTVKSVYDEFGYHEVRDIAKAWTFSSSVILAAFLVLDVTKFAIQLILCKCIDSVAGAGIHFERIFSSREFATKCFCQLLVTQYTGCNHSHDG